MRDSMRQIIGKVIRSLDDSMEESLFQTRMVSVANCAFCKTEKHLAECSRCQKLFCLECINVVEAKDGTSWSLAPLCLNCQATTEIK